MGEANLNDMGKSGPSVGNIKKTVTAITRGGRSRRNGEPGLQASRLFYQSTKFLKFAQKIVVSLAWTC
jgi:hypothetical protein